MPKSLKTRFLETKFDAVPAYTLSMRVSQLLKIAYVAVRGVDSEPGSVQRVLSKRRIDSIKTYVLDGNVFFNSFIINWTEPNYQPKFEEERIFVPLVDSAAQVIDGQHRLAGLEAAVEEKPDIGKTHVIVTLCIKLTTKEAAKIFLNINTEQKPVPRSLMYDLFGEVVNDDEHAINRATDIARGINNDTSSALYKMIKFPGSPRGTGAIELSTFVGAIKDQLMSKGSFRKVNITELALQRAAIDNFFMAIKDAYTAEGLWDAKSTNPFFRAAGFNGAMEFFTSLLVAKCAERHSFTVETIKEILGLDTKPLLLVSDIKGMDGKSARSAVKNFFEYTMLGSLPANDDYAF